MFFRPKRKYAVLTSPAEQKLIRFSLTELRNKLLKEDFDTQDVDALILRLTEHIQLNWNLLKMNLVKINMCQVKLNFT